VADAKTILIADDDAGHLRVLDMILSVDGHAVVAVEDGREALAWLREHTPDLAILDVAMPLVDGVDICTRMKRVKRLAHVPVIILTALRDDATRELARLARADALVLKPLEGKDFRELVRSVMSGATLPI
jgi:DNA-binding response OmpR family regulator